MRKSLWIAIVLLLQCVSLAYAGDAPVPKDLQLNEKDFICSGTSRVDLLKDENLRRGVVAMINDVRSSLKFDAKGIALLDSTHSQILNVKKTTDTLEFQVNTGKRPKPLAVRKNQYDVQISEANGSDPLSVILMDGQPNLILTIRKIIIWNKESGTFREETQERVDPYQPNPELARKTIWPQLPHELKFDSSIDPGSQEKIKKAYDLLVSIANEVKLRQPNAKYVDMGRLYVGQLPGWDTIQNLSFTIARDTHMARKLVVSFADGKKKTIELDPVFIHEFAGNGHTTMMVRITRDGKVSAQILERIGPGKRGPNGNTSSGSGLKVVIPH